MELPSEADIIEMAKVSNRNPGICLHSLRSISNKSSPNSSMRIRQFMIILKSQFPDGYIAWKAQRNKPSPTGTSTVSTAITSDTPAVESTTSSETVNNPNPVTDSCSLRIDQSKCTDCDVLLYYDQTENSLICPECNISKQAKYIDISTFIRPRSRNVSMTEYRRISPMVKFVTQFHQDCPPRPQQLIDLIWSHLYTFRHSTCRTHVRIVHIRNILGIIGQPDQIPYTHRIALQMIMPNESIPLMSKRVASEVIAYIELHPKKKSIQDHFLDSLRAIGQNELADRFFFALDHIRQRNVSVHNNRRTCKRENPRRCKFQEKKSKHA